MINCGTTMFIFLQVVVCQSLPDDSVNGKDISRLSQRWIQNTQWLNNSGIQLGLRAGKRTTKPTTLSTVTRQIVNIAAEHAKKFTTKRRTRTRRLRTTMYFESATEPCHYLVMNCLRAYQTGKVCARTIYNMYFTFKNYCMLDFTNCMLRYQIWRVLHMGDCFGLKLLSTHKRMPEVSSHLMDGIYVVDLEY